MFRSNVLVCGGTGCTSSNSEQIIEKLQEEIKAQGLEKEVNVIRTGCFGLCALGPIMVVYPEGAFYSRVTVEDVPEIVSEHLLKGRIVKRLLYQETVVDDNTTKSLNETTFYAKQMRIALRNCGVINPENIDEYIAQDGYAALGKVLTEMTPQEVIDLVLASGLRGRGGAGFPTGRKWQFARNNDAPQKYACCNADEGDPGAFMDRSVLEGDPHSVLEAMAFRETGMREGHGNFTWAANSSSFFLWVVMTGVFLRTFTQDARSGALRSVRGLGYAAVGGLFLWHAYSSVYYLHYLLTTTNAF